MACDNCSDEMRAAYRHHNRALRTVNRNLRRKVERSGATADELFTAICEVDVQAQNAFGELWGSALFDCGPQDYEYMVAEIKKAFATLEAQRAETQPVERIAD